MIRDEILVWSWRAVAAAGGLLAVVASLVLVVSGETAFWTEWSGGPFAVSFAVFFSVLSWLVIASQPRNRLVWVMAVSSFFWGVYSAGGWAFVTTYPGEALKLITDPSAAPVDLPVDAAWVMALTFTGWLPALFPIVTLGLLLFPDGRVSSPRWRWVAILATLGIGVSTTSTWWTYRPGSVVPYNQPIGEDPIATGLIVAGLLTVAVSLLALIARFRRSAGELRQQFKWIVWGGSVFVVGVFAAFLFEGTAYEVWAEVLFIGGGGVFLASYGVAVGKYRLYDVDLVISRTFVYGMLGVFITGVYVAAVLGVGSLLGGDAQSSPALAIGATAVVAFAFEPLRERLQRVANRLVYGRRATPYEVLSEFSRRIAASDEELLDQVARSLVEGTTASEASVWMTVEGTLTRVAVWPDRAPERAVTVEDHGGLPEADLVRPVVHDGETLGVLALAAGRGQNVLPTDARLLEQVASGMGLALRNIRLREELKRQIEELRSSRLRLVAVQDETRRHLERDLHDGAQQRLVALKVKLALARRQARAAGTADVADLLEQLAIDTDRAVDSLRDFARGIYPPLLEAEGVAAAIGAQVHKLPIPVTVHAAGVDRLSPPVEAALYFCVLECLQNVVKHAGATSAHVTLRRTDDLVTFEVSDDGKGFAPHRTSAGTGLGNLADRLDALDGVLGLDSAPDRGTTIQGTIPLRALEVAQ